MTTASLIISPYQHLNDVLARHDIARVISILGPSDGLRWPDTGSRQVLRLAFDDTQYSSGQLIAPTRAHIMELIQFARDWADLRSPSRREAGQGSLLVHCRAGSSRSPAGAMIAVAAIGRMDLVGRIAEARSYFRPHQGCLRLADSLLGSGLVDLARMLVPTRIDEAQPVVVRL